MPDMVALIERTCDCGCGMTFKCMKSSPQKFASRECEASTLPGGHTALYKRDVVKKAQLARKKKRLEEEMPGPEIEILEEDECPEEAEEVEPVSTAYCENPSCPNKTRGTRFCSDACARPRPRAAVPTPSTPDQGPSGTKAGGGPSGTSSSGGSSMLSDSGEDMPKKSFVSNDSVMLGSGTPEIENDNEHDIENDGTPYPPQSDPSSMLLGPIEHDVTPTLPERSSSTSSPETQIMEFIAPSLTSEGEGSRRESYIDSSLRQLNELMRDVAKENPRQRLSPHMIRAVCDCAKNTRELLKLKLEIYQEARKGYEKEAPQTDRR